MIHLAHMPWSTPWIAWSLGLYVLAIACWLPVVWIQLRLRDLSGQAVKDGTPLQRGQLLADAEGRHAVVVAGQVHAAATTNERVQRL